ncbi:hypothetical protein T265_16292, partial [Opisthorchis viverrini]
MGKTGRGLSNGEKMLNLVSDNAKQVSVFLHNGVGAKRISVVAGNMNPESYTITLQVSAFHMSAVSAILRNISRCVIVDTLLLRALSRSEKTCDLSIKFKQHWVRALDDLRFQTPISSCFHELACFAN